MHYLMHLLHNSTLLIFSHYHSGNYHLGNHHSGSIPSRTSVIGTRKIHQIPYTISCRAHHKHRTRNLINHHVALLTSLIIFHISLRIYPTTITRISHGHLNTIAGKIAKQPSPQESLNESDIESCVSSTKSPTYSPKKLSSSSYIFNFAIVLFQSY